MGTVVAQACSILEQRSKRNQLAAILGDETGTGYLAFSPPTYLSTCSYCKTQTNKAPSQCRNCGAPVSV